MKGSAFRLIRKFGSEYAVLNAEESGADREVPEYQQDGEIVALIEERSEPAVETNSAGEEVTSNLRMRAVDPERIFEAGSTKYPTRLERDGRTYEVLSTHLEDSAVTRLGIVRV